jgi:predicted phosphodiesterase
MRHALNEVTIEGPAGRRIYIAHGHESDSWCRSGTFASKASERLSQTVGVLEKVIDPNIDHVLNNFCPVTVGVAREHGIHTARDGRYDVVVYGHTHEAEEVTDYSRGKYCIYANTGRCVDCDRFVDEIIIEIDIYSTIEVEQRKVLD